MKIVSQLAAGVFLACCAGAAALAHSSHAHGPGSDAHVSEAYAAGDPGDPAKTARIIAVTMHENIDGSMGFSPDEVEVKKGEQIRFELKNAGKTPHEFMLDSAEHNARHKIAMEKNPDMQHDDPNGKRLDAGASAEILWRFSKPGTYEFACLIPGHYEAGMHGKVIVK